jgi:hypothetical protein
MILEVFILEGLQAEISEVRILKDLVKTGVLGESKEEERALA